MNRPLKKIGMALFCACLILGSSQAPGQTQEKRFRIALFTPRNDEFWTLYANIAKAACEDLGMDLEWHPAMNKPERQLADVKAVLSRPGPKIDAMVYKNFDGTAGEIMALAEKAKVYSLMVEEGYTDAELEKYGVPRSKFKYWIGEFLPDNQDGGFEQTKVLVRLAHQKHRLDKHQQIQMAVVAGNMVEGSSTERVLGMHIALQEYREVLLHQIVAGYWKKAVAYRKTQRLLQDYPELSTYWTGNDTMPQGVYQAVKDYRAKHPAYPQAIIGGSGSTPPAGFDVETDRIQVTVGGPFLLSAFSMVLLHDFLHGIDFAEESTTMRLCFYVFTRENVHAYTSTLGKAEWNKVNFARFSKHLNPGLTKYDFGFGQVLEQFKALPDPMRISEFSGIKNESLGSKIAQ
ncbi:hypothetical protein COW36_19410 [bacterium (Candidatus Blackallbacteria) CG17_big_fil_post_rev_8_21_14_2_50_48_46]|uniref:Periplasmic binding protein domain-containing protein n=1 Tax=bacterium (Candidatus Blackallbacteria) CG17_big_fil_post_rev_8_21_14_2_50_48_46 TaxID=2014261 RepID=A0A2M7G0K2_9BACT|nr:MAG: hypothetical protein COW64_25060 [bacterium (Candidatus Blackallbacteria) CG18_big_fil_WC_8_21_14_2_50_49_26]PIW15091.1 MAG: hypothetical protein COW36_19410 [bacterium (Candidatus Blackallbacteria) CG17_big_fil_post_rev_8_21_14_2_50_48_46]PIW47586.1 MAG: hypothetical protein COW20_11910 [bacterium (Candidatus Blackallbacteria) CG13_big_fil_rev_8_21_14_2_50_49_14]